MKTAKAPDGLPKEIGLVSLLAGLHEQFGCQSNRAIDEARFRYRPLRSQVGNDFRQQEIPVAKLLGLSQWHIGPENQNTQ